jgi:hypothetical protein
MYWHGRNCWPRFVFLVVLIWVLSVGSTASQETPPGEAAGSPSEPAVEAKPPVADAREAQIRSLIAGELDVAIDPQSLFDIPLSDEVVIGVERARVAAVVDVADELAKPTPPAEKARGRAAAPVGRIDEAGAKLREEVVALDPADWQRRIDLDRARLEFYSLSKKRRAKILKVHAARQEAAIPRETDEQRRQREAEAERQRALEAARVARTEAERLVGEEDARLIALGEGVASIVAGFEKDRAALAERRDVVLGWQRRVREAEADSAAVADETYDALRRALRAARDELSAALDALSSNVSAVPPLGDDALRDLPADVPGDEVRARRVEVAKQIAAAQREERSFREETAITLGEEVTSLNQERLGLLPYLSSGKRGAIVGFTAAGFDQARAEARHLLLLVRYHNHTLRQWIFGLRKGGPSVAGAWNTATVLIPWTIFAAVFLSVRRRMPNLVRTAQARLEDADRIDRRTFPSPQTRAMSILARVHGSIGWILFFAGTLWLLPSEVFELLEVQVLTSVAGWVLGGQLVVSVINAVAAVSGTTAFYEDAVVDELRLRSLRLVGRTIVAFALILVLSDRLVGEGTIYSWALSLCWFAAIPVFLVLVRWWRGTIFTRIDRVRRKSKLEEWVLANRSGWQSFLAAMVGAIHLFTTGIVKIAGRWMSGFELARRGHAYLFQREIERLGDTHKLLKLRPLDADKREALHPEVPQDRWLACPADELIGELSARVASGRGGMVALVGSRGMGKSAVFRALRERFPEAVGLECRQDTTLREVQDVLERGASAAAQSATTTTRLVLLDDAQALIRLVIDGLRVFDELSMLARGRCEDTLWVYAIDSSVWPYLERSRDARPIFDEIHWLEPWNETQIGALLAQRCGKAGISPIFDDLIDPLPLGADDLDRFDALQAKRAGYERMLWDHATGNPGIALEVWRSSLAQDDRGVVHVRSLQVPEATLLDELPDASLFVLRAVIQMSPAAIDDVARATRLPRSDVLDMIRFGTARGVFAEQEGRIRVTWHWLRPVMRILERRHLMVAR